MKQSVTTAAVFVLFTLGTYAQNVEQRIEDKSKARANNKVDRNIDKGLDKVEQGIDSLFLKKKHKKGTADNQSSAPATPAANVPAAGTKNNPKKDSVVSFSDFIPGSQVLFTDDFSLDALNDFPAKWNSTGSGKVVTLTSQQGRWLALSDNTLVRPELDKPLPENCTIEFDLFLQSEEGKTTPYIQFGFSNSKDIIRQDVYYSEKFWVAIDQYNEANGYSLTYGVNLLDALGNKKDFPLNSYTDKVLHVSIALNKTRLRVYLDKTKIIDLPKIMTPEMRNTFYVCNYPKGSNLELLLANLRIATAETDARSLLVKQLMDEGKAVTNDILFDVNKDVIKKESYALINQLGDALKTNPGLNIKIIGHTDSDGTAAANIELSKKRALAVKQYLQDNYSIAASRIQTDGKGATQPVASNSTADGKAKNRRVEFIKL